MLTNLDADTRARVRERYDRVARPPTTGELSRALKEAIALVTDAKQQSTVDPQADVRMLVWIAAHGGSDGSLYFGDGRYPRLLLAKELFKATDEAGIDLDLILDSCWPRAVVGRGAGDAGLERAHARARAGAPILTVSIE